jgi:hypothetical protein
MLTAPSLALHILDGATAQFSTSHLRQPGASDGGVTKVPGLELLVDQRRLQLALRPM